MTQKIFKSIKSYNALEDLGRVKLSDHYFMRDFLYSEISNFYGIPNYPDDPDMAIEAGRKLCENLIEPLHDVFGHVSIRSGYRSPAVNQAGNEKGHNCASNENNYGHHIWYKRDKYGYMGATACIVIPWFADRFAKDGDWQKLAWWIHDNLPYSSLYFFPKLFAFNIRWCEKPERIIQSYAAPKGTLTKENMDNFDVRHEAMYEDMIARLRDGNC